jgi:hypothetical protein
VILNVGGLNHVAFDSARHSNDFPDSAVPGGIDAEMDHKIHTCRDGRHH